MDGLLPFDKEKDAQIVTVVMRCGLGRDALPESVKLVFDLFLEAAANIPDTDAALVQTKAPDMTKEQAKMALACNRWCNPICEGCFTKKENVPLFLCRACKLAFYCSAKCQESHSVAHSKRCCKLDGPLDQGPQAIVFLKVNDKKQDERKDDEEEVPRSSSYCWDVLEQVSQRFETTKRAGPKLVQIASQCVMALVMQHGQLLQDIERELRKRNFFVWLFASSPKEFQYRRMQAPNEFAKYAMFISIGSREFFEEHDLKREGRTYEENFDILNECGVCVVKDESKQ